MNFRHSNDLKPILFPGNIENAILKIATIHLDRVAAIQARHGNESELESLILRIIMRF